MTKEQLQAMVEQALIEEVAERVAEKLLCKQKKALVVYTGSTFGFANALENLKKLRENGFEFTVYISEGAAQLLDKEAIVQALKPTRLLTGRLDCMPEQLALPFGTVIVPALSANATAHMAMCMADTTACRIIFSSMMRGKNVILAIDGSCPDNAERLAAGYCMTPALCDRLRDNLESLRAYGAALTTADRLFDKTMRSMAFGFAKQEQGAAAPATAKQPVLQSLACKVLSRAAISQMPVGSVLEVEKGMLVTQLARDEARLRGVIIRQN